jgi:drug/metabolite transporter (DMT)-like permease
LHQHNIPLAIVVMVMASLFFATGATLQHTVIGTMVDHHAANKTMGASQLVNMVTNPRWLGALAVVVCGFLLHVTAITMAPVTVIQPLGILAVPWSILMASKIHGHRITGRMWLAVGITLAGIVIFTSLAAANPAPEHNTHPEAVLRGSLVVYGLSVVFIVLAVRGKSALWRSLWWATGGAFLFGLSSALIKALSVMLRAPGFMYSTWFWVLGGIFVVTLAAGGLLIQQGYACGPAEVVVGSMDTTDPIVGVSFGLILLGEGARIGPITGAFMMLAALVAVSGVVLLLRYHPNATNAHQAVPHHPVAGHPVLDEPA